MSFNISFASPKAKAKTELATRNKEGGGTMPAVVEQAIAALIDAFPETELDGYSTLNVATYGHFRGDEPGSSNVVVQIQWVADVAADTA